ncbi:MFS transporter [Leptospira sp. GIMC2001]|uniref:MFS transporter n=1 Tax=Leptospira sp. GIMC2001 TaxID=1513297 RepID=UPI00234922F3|nr:MFS transporter [Leptospira sp. GIMC2001]WCL48864.1 MFS transporter [Leptospira sp. GIMC2001]
MFRKFANLFKPAPAIPRLPQDEIDAKYPKFRWQILESTFIGYSVFYLVRNNFPLVSKEIGQALSYSKEQIGDILAVTAIAYGIGKFLMGALSDRSNPRIFMPFGLLLTAGLNFCFGFSENYHMHLLLWTLNGLVQGMGWPPCGRSLGHWYSLKERGTVFAFWNISHNVGGGLVGIIAAYSASFFGWQYAFFIPGIICVFASVYLFARLRDTPQSVGLPSIEEYRNDFPAPENDPLLGEISPVDPANAEKELTSYDLIVENVLKNKIIWIFAIANLFVYMVRYSLLDWGPTYLKEIKGATLTSGGASTFIYEFAGIGSTLLMGWVSDKTGGRRGMVSLLCLIPILFAFVGIIVTPPGFLWIDLTLFAVIGFFIYPPVMLLGVAALDFTSKKAVGTAAGFIGLFGYVFGRTIQAKAIGYLSEHYSWSIALWFIFFSCIGAILLLSFTWRLKPKS